MKLSNGFTLVELMIVVAIIAILASVGYPAYTNYVTQGKLLDATSGLSDGRIKMEQFFKIIKPMWVALAPARLKTLALFVAI